MGNHNGCQVQAAFSSQAPLATSLTITEPYHDLMEVVTDWELTLKPGGNAFLKQNADLKHCNVRG